MKRAVDGIGIGKLQVNKLTVGRIMDQVLLAVRLIGHSLVLAFYEKVFKGLYGILVFDAGLSRLSMGVSSRITTLHSRINR